MYSLLIFIHSLYNFYYRMLRGGDYELLYWYVMYWNSQIEVSVKLVYLAAPWRLLYSHLIYRTFWLLIGSCKSHNLLALIFLSLDSLISYLFVLFNVILSLVPTCAISTSISISIRIIVWEPAWNKREISISISTRKRNFSILCACAYLTLVLISQVGTGVS